MTSQAEQPPRREIGTNLAFVGLFYIVGMFVVFIAWLSLRWHPVIDTPIMLYFGFLIDHAHYIPYRDFWDVNLPGTFFISALLGRLSGYDDLNLRLLDLLYLGCVLLATWQFLNQYGRKVAVFGVVLFAMVYLAGGAYTMFQRDALFLLPIALAMLLATSNSRRLTPILRCFGIGLLFGLTATVKPHSAIGLPVLWLFAVWEIKVQQGRQWRPFQWIIPLLIAAGIGLALPILAVVIYLWRAGSLNAFLNMIVNYQPLYVNIAGNHEVIVGWPRVLYLIQNGFGFGGYQVWFIPAIIALAIAFGRSALNDAQKRHIWLMIGLVIAYILYPVIGGQFPTYQYLPFAYLMVLISALCFVKQREPSSAVMRWLPLAATLFVVVIGKQYLSYDFAAQISTPGFAAPREDRAYDIASYFQAHLKPGDRVQPIDWASGGIHAMLLSQAEIATPFIFDFQFHYFVSTPFVQRLRQQFITALRSSKPRYILYMTVFPWPDSFGPDTSGRFDELQQVIADSYSVRVSGNGYLIYERNPEYTF